ncbi:MAG: isoleucine--tRNA ligase, partial [Clostridia bacterium]|nr:isoleucine--tRNA ligase [Clostridia bacterium]
KYDLPFVQLVNSKGEMTEETPWSGMFCKDADKEVFKALSEAGLLFAALPFEHSYPFCWRCDTPLIYYARESWFIKMTAVRDDLIRNNETINWIPKTIGEGRFGDWLKNVQDWGVSRDRYWGTPLNIWECSCGHRHAIGSIAELKEMSDNCPENIELHRPFVDAVTIKCPECGGEMKRVKEVIDCWFDSGAMPFAQWHYPFENADIFEDNFPANFISEAVDQTRGWFYSLLAISTLLFNKAPYKNVIVLGHVQDENGQKMSKSKGNAVDPFETLEKHGADAVRWYFYSNSAPWLPNRYHDAAVTEGQRKFMGTLWNTYAFYVLYAEIDQFDPTKYTLNKETLSVMDKWLLSKLNTLVKTVDNYLAEYRITEPSKALSDFVDELSNWYVRRSRERFWVKEMTEDKINAYMTLYTALVTVAKLAAPMVPFMTEDIYRNLVCSVDKDAPISIHLCDYPVCDESFVDEKLEKEMEEVLSIVVLGRSVRNSANIKTKQPLSRMIVKAEAELPEFCTDIITEEINVKAVEFTNDLGNLVSYNVKPKFDSLRAKFPNEMGMLIGIINKADAGEVVSAIESDGHYKVTLPTGVSVLLERDDLIIETKKTEGFEAASDYGITVALDTSLTPELIEEGSVREIISNIQKMRKNAGFEVMDRIFVYQSGNDSIADVMKKNEAEIADVCLVDSFFYGENTEIESEIKVNGEKTVIGVKKN